MQGQPHTPRTPVFVQIDDEVIALLTKASDQFLQVWSKFIDLVDVWIGGIDGTVGRFGQHVKFRIGILRANTSDDRRGQHDIADGTEPNEQDLFQTMTILWQR